MKSNLVTSGILVPEIQDDGRIVNVEFKLDDDMETIYVGSSNSTDTENSKSAISAYADLLSHGIWDHPDTDKVGGTVLIREKANLNAFYASDIGYVNVGYEGTKFPRITRASYPMGWAQIHRRAGTYFVSDPQNPDVQSRYCDWVQSAILGYNLKARTLPYQDWIVAVLENLSIESAEERLADRNNRYNNRVDRNRLNTKVRKDLRAINAGATNLVPDGAIVVKLYGSEDTVDMNELPAQTVQIHTNRGARFFATWNPASIGARVQFSKLAGAAGWSVELNPRM